MKTLLAIGAACALFVLSTGPAAAGRNLHNLSGTLRNLDSFGKLSERYYDGTNVLLTHNSDAEYVKKHILRIQGDIKRAQSYFNALTAEEKASADGKAAAQKLAFWLDYDTRLVAAYNRAVKSKGEGDAKCNAFKQEVMTNQRMYSIINLAGRSDNTGGSPGSLEEIKERARFVAAACAKPEYKDVGVNSCAYMKVGSNPLWDPQEWCEVAPRWQEILTRRVDAEVTKLIGSFDNRPLLAGKLTGEQHMTFFSEAVPNSDGWRHVFFYQDLALSDEIAQRYLERINGMYAAIEVDRKIDATALAPIERAFEQLRADADAAAPGYELPKSAGSDYSVSLARKQVAKFSVKTSYKKGFLGRSSWKVHENSLGVPERRTKPGYVLVQPRGQKWCTLITYTVTEDYLGGGKYQKAKGVLFESGRFQRCK